MRTRKTKSNLLFLLLGIRSFPQRLSIIPTDKRGVEFISRQTNWVWGGNSPKVGWKICAFGEAWNIQGLSALLSKGLSEKLLHREHGVCETQMGIKWNEAWLSHALYNQWESLVYEFMHQLEILLRPMALANPISRSGDFVIAAGKAVDTAKITLYFVLDLATSHLNLTAIYQLMVWAWT